MLVNEDVKPTPAQIAACKKFADTDVSTGKLDEWYVLLRKAQEDFSLYTNGKLGYMIDNKDFVSDSLFCEYAYIINIDDQTLEVYQGFNHDPKAPGRYAALISDKKGQKANGYGKPGNPFYYGVRLITATPLADLRNVLANAPRPMTAKELEERHPKAKGPKTVDPADDIAAGWQKAMDDIYEAQRLKIDREKVRAGKAVVVEVDQ